MTFITSLKGEPAQKAHVVERFFSQIEPSFDTPFRSARQIADCVLGYTGDILEVDKTNLIYSSDVLQKDYADRSQTDPLKAKPLKVISMNSPEQRERIKTLFLQWQKDAETEYRKIVDQLEDRLITKKTLFERIAFPSACKGLLVQAVADDFLAISVSAVVDGENQIQGISYSHPDKRRLSAWHIEMLLTAPHNGIETSPIRVKGVGCALIEDAIQKSMKRQGLTSPCSAKAMENSVVTLQMSSSFQFYKSTFFKRGGILQGDNLQGDNLLEFLRYFGGRATI